MIGGIGTRPCRLQSIGPRVATWSAYVCVSGRVVGVAPGRPKCPGINIPQTLVAGQEQLGKAGNAGYNKFM